MNPWNRKAEPFRVCWTFAAMAPLYWRTSTATFATIELAEAEAAKRAADRRNYTIDIDRAMDDWRSELGWKWRLVRNVKRRGIVCKL